MRIAEQGIFEPSEVKRLLSEHLTGRRDHRKQLWTLFVFQLWHRRWADRGPSTSDDGAPNLSATRASTAR